VAAAKVAWSLCQVTHDEQTGLVNSRTWLVARVVRFLLFTCEMRSFITVLLFAVGATGCVEVVEEDLGGSQQGLLCAPVDGTSHSIAISFVEHEHPIVGDLAVPCAVTSVAPGSTLGLELACDHAAPTDLHMSATVANVPSDLVVPLATGDEVLVDYHHRQASHHIEAATWLIVHDAAGTMLLFAAIDDDGLAASPAKIANAGARIAPFSLTVDESVCEAPCAAGDAGCNAPHRYALDLTGADAVQATVHDASRGELETAGARYDVVVGMARSYTTLNVGSDYQILIAALPPD
jgi:hypothetical protein